MKKSLVTLLITALAVTTAALMSGCGSDTTSSDNTTPDTPPTTQESKDSEPSSQQTSGMHFSDDIVNVPGTSVMGEQRHAEYQVDSDALLELILSIFYEPVEG